MYWPNINKDIEHMTRTCTVCQELANCNRKEPLIPHDTLMAPWKKLGTDVFAVDSEHFMLICDYFSKYPIVTPLHATTSENVTEEIRKAVSLFGQPDEIVSDNGPQYIGKPFQDFVHKWGIQHTTSSPRFPESNEFIERQVQTIKEIIKKCKEKQEPTPCHARPSSDPSRLQAAITCRDVEGQAYHHIASFPHLSISRHCCTTSTFGSQTVDDEVQL